MYSKLKVSKMAIVDKILSEVKFTPNGNESYQKKANVKLEVDENLYRVQSMKYLWSQSSTETPESTKFSTTCENNGSIESETSANGEWYLWVLVKFDNNEEIISRSNVFYFDNTGPDVTVSGLNSDSKPTSLIASAEDLYSNIENFEIYIGDELISSGKNGENSFEFEYEDSEWKSFNLTVKCYDSLGNSTTSNPITIVPEYRWDEYGVLGTNTWIVKRSDAGYELYPSNYIIPGTAGEKYTADTANQTFKISGTPIGTNCQAWQICTAPAPGIYVVSSDKKTMKSYMYRYAQSGSYSVETHTYYFEYDAYRMDEASLKSSNYSKNLNLHTNDAKSGNSWWKIGITRWNVQ